jgi:hypothetical protein
MSDNVDDKPAVDDDNAFDDGEQRWPMLVLMVYGLFSIIHDVGLWIAKRSSIDVQSNSQYALLELIYSGVGWFLTFMLLYEMASFAWYATRQCITSTRRDIFTFFRPVLAWCICFLLVCGMVARVNADVKLLSILT